MPPIRPKPSPRSPGAKKNTIMPKMTARTIPMIAPVLRSPQKSSFPYCKYPKAIPITRISR